MTITPNKNGSGVSAFGEVFGRKVVIEAATPPDAWVIFYAHALEVKAQMEKQMENSNAA